MSNLSSCSSDSLDFHDFDEVVYKWLDSSGTRRVEVGYCLRGQPDVMWKGQRFISVMEWSFHLKGSLDPLFSAFKNDNTVPDTESYELVNNTPEMDEMDVLQGEILSEESSFWNE